MHISGGRVHGFPKILKKYFWTQICLEYLKSIARLILLQWLKHCFKYHKSYLIDSMIFYSYSMYFLRTTLGIRVTILKRHWWFFSYGANTLLGKPEIIHEEFWEDKLENVCKHITECASKLPVCSYIHFLPFLALFYIIGLILQTTLCRLFWHLASLWVSLMVGRGRRLEGLKQNEPKITLLSLFALGGSLGGGSVSSLAVVPARQLLPLWFKYPFGDSNSWHMVTLLLP